MNGSYYPQEYLDSAYSQGYNAFWIGEDKPPTTMPHQEKDAWQNGWDDAHQEAMDASNN
jgi:ribosome modulation factor